MTDVNAHLHTPWSFSAFRDISQALDMAAQQGVKVVGINDFYTTEGYAEWVEGCRQRRLYPLLGIEMIALSAAERDAGVRVNDPNNPGRTYISGKGLNYPVTLGGAQARMLASVRAETQKQVSLMCSRLNEHLCKVGAGFSLDFLRIEKELSLGQVRERHLARALRLAVEVRTGGGAEGLSPARAEALAGDPDSASKELYSRIFGAAPKADPADPAAIENEIRSRLLKAGGAAFVPESPGAFLPVEAVCDIIRAAGGVPTYPFLADNSEGGFTDFEADLQRAADSLRGKGIRSVEFITTRNSTAVLESYASYLEDEGFTVSFGSEHNTPSMEPLLLRTRDSAALSDRLRAINWRGACAIAAHQAGADSPDAGETIINQAINL